MYYILLAVVDKNVVFSSITLEWYPYSVSFCRLRVENACFFSSVSNHFLKSGVIRLPDNCTIFVAWNY